MNAERSLPRTLAAATLLLFGCVETQPLPEPPKIGPVLEKLGLDRYDAIEPASVTWDRDWELLRFDPAGPARCLDGSPFVVSVRKGDPDKLLLYLEGGGACWDFESCHGSTPLAKRTSEPIPRWMEDKPFFAARSDQGGFREYTVAFASYCDGSVWSGDGEPVYGGIQTWHRGMANTSAAVHALASRFPDASRVVVAGSSAGGYGTMMGYLVARHRFPDADMAVWNDSGPWLFNPKKETMQAAIMDEWKLRSILPEDCEKCDEQLIYLADYVLARDRKLRIGLFSYEYDLTLSVGYLGLGGAYLDLLRETTDAIHKKHPERFRRVFLPGSEHTIAFTDEYTVVQENGQTMAEWVQALADASAEWIDQPGGEPASE